jgi:hypothetical protein
MPARSMSPRSFYETLIAQMPAGLERAILRVPSDHIGKENTITKPKLLQDLARLGFHQHERQVRECIEIPRNHGHLIGASSGDGGYFIIATDEEWQAYYAEENGRAMKILERLSAQKENANKVFLPAAEKATQAGLF